MKIKIVSLAFLFFTQSMDIAAKPRQLEDTEMEKVDATFYGGSPLEIQQNVDKNANAPLKESLKIVLNPDTSSVRLGNPANFAQEDLRNDFAEYARQEDIYNNPAPPQTEPFQDFFQWRANKNNLK